MKKEQTIISLQIPNDLLKMVDEEGAKNIENRSETIRNIIYDHYYKDRRKGL